MSLVLAVLLAALALGWARGGTLEHLGALPLRARALVLAALAAQVGGALRRRRRRTRSGSPSGPASRPPSSLRNRGTRGTGLVGLGFAANALVVVLNGAMPVSLEASERAGVTTQYLLTGDDRRHEVLDDATRLPLLADVVPVPLPRVPQVVSAGDVLVAAGAGQLVVLGMGRRSGPGRRRQDAGRDWLRGGVRPAG